MASTGLLRSLAALLLVTAVLGNMQQYTVCLKITGPAGAASNGSIRVRFVGDQDQKTDWIIVDQVNDESTAGQHNTGCYNKSEASIGRQIIRGEVQRYETQETLCVTNLYTYFYYESALYMYNFKGPGMNTPGCLRTGGIYAFKKSGAGQRHVCGSLLVLSVLATLARATGIFTY